MTDEQKDPKNLSVKLSVDELYAKNADLEALNTQLTAKNKEITEQLDEANAVLNAQTKKTLVGKVEKMTDYPRAELEKMGVDELENLYNTAMHLNRKISKSVRSYGQDEQTPSKLNGNPFEQLWGKKQ